MERKIEEILNEHRAQVSRFNEEKASLIQTMKFAELHNFDEEYRIASIKFKAMHEVAYSYSQMHDEISEVLNKWQS